MIKRLNKIDKKTDKRTMTSFSVLYRDCLGKAPLIADYPILVFVAQVMGEQGRNLTDSQIRNCLKYSRDYHEASEGKELWLKEIKKANFQYLQK